MFITSKIELILFMFIFTLVPSFFGCAGKETRPVVISTQNLINLVPIIADKESLTLTWVTDTNCKSIDYYELFYRNDLVSDWVRFELEIPATETTKVILYRSQFKDTASAFFFAIRSANNSGYKSAYLQSDDCGWFILWDSIK